MLNKDKIKEEFEKKFISKTFDSYQGWTIQEIEEVFAHLSAQYEKLIEECLPEESDYYDEYNRNDGIYGDGFRQGFNGCLSHIRTSLQERGIKIK